METGEFTWKVRPPSTFLKPTWANSWNAKYSGKRAGSLQAKGYWGIGIHDRVWLAHRLAWVIVTGEWPIDQIDHVNGDKLDNRWNNLREANNAQNHANLPLRRDNSVGLKGVRFNGNGKWVAQLSKKYLGTFDCPAAAHFAYQIEAYKVFGEFSRAA